MTRPSANLKRRDRELDVAALRERAAELAPMLDETEAKSEPPSRPAMTVPLCLLRTGHPFLLGGVVYRADDSECEVNGVKCRAARTHDWLPAWIPSATEVEPVYEGTP